MKHVFKMYKVAQHQIAACIKIYGIFRSVSKILYSSLCVIVAHRKEDCKDNTTFNTFRALMNKHLHLHWIKIRQYLKYLYH